MGVVVGAAFDGDFVGAKDGTGAGVGVVGRRVGASVGGLVGAEPKNGIML